MAEIRAQRKKGIPLIWLLLGLILLALAAWALVEWMGDDETASLAPPERQVLVAGPAGETEAPPATMTGLVT
jgi:flagellar basal body-associated protein FliL